MIDTATNTVVATVPTGASPVGVAVNSAGTRTYVTNYSDASISVIDTVTNTVIAIIAVGSEPTGIVVSPTGTRAYVANYNSSTVSVIDTATNTVIGTVAAGTTPHAFGLFIGPTSIAPTAITTAIPTLSEWGMILLAGMLGLFGMVVMRRRSE